MIILINFIVIALLFAQDTAKFAYETKKDDPEKSNDPNYVMEWLNLLKCLFCPFGSVWWWIAAADSVKILLFYHDEDKVWEVRSVWFLHDLFNAHPLTWLFCGVHHSFNFREHSGKMFNDWLCDPCLVPCVSYRSSIAEGPPGSFSFYSQK